MAESWTHWVMVSLARSSWVNPAFIRHSASPFEVCGSFVVAYIAKQRNILQAYSNMRQQRYQEISIPTVNRWETTKHFSVIVIKKAELCRILEVGENQSSPQTKHLDLMCHVKVSRKVLNPESGVGHEGLSGLHKNRLLTSQSSWHGACNLFYSDKELMLPTFLPSLNTR